MLKYLLLSDSDIGQQEVSGSIPLISTKMKDSCSRKGHESFIVKKEMGGYLILTCQGLESDEKET